MASLIKSQIIKHLSKFARNITPDQIRVEILSGKGELKNIELNEVVLTEVLELPCWLRIKEAKCNRVAIKIPWTRLKSSPVQLFLDEIQVHVELTSDAPTFSGTHSLSLSSGGDSYGFANRVVEGMSLYINTVEIHFESGVFGGSLMLSRLSVESRSPGWQAINDLRSGRIAETSLNQILLFKQVTWQLLRIEASARIEQTLRSNINAPLRLITSSGRCRIAIKKSSLDNTVLRGRIEMILEDILWVATVPQVRSAIIFYSHIVDLAKSAAKKSSTDPSPKTIPVSRSKSSLSAKTASTVGVSQAFKTFDFEQTSYHLYVGKIDLHLCDDVNASTGYPRDWDIESGALQVTLVRLSIDVYLENIANSDRKQWVRYSPSNPCAHWIQQILKNHYKDLSACLDTNNLMRFAHIWPHLLSQNCVIRMHDIIVQCVTDLNSKRDAIFNCFMSDRKSKASLPLDQPLFHLEFTSFYHPTSEHMPLPPNITHLLLGPFCLLLDERTIRWVLYVYEDISYALRKSDVNLEMDNIPQTNVRIDLIMPKVVVPLCDEWLDDRRLPRRLILSMSTVQASNCVALCNLDSSNSFHSLSSNMIDFIDGTRLPFDILSFRNFVIQLNQSAVLDLEQDCRRFWVNTSPIWVDTDSGEGTRALPVLGDVAFHIAIEITASQVNAAVQPLSTIRLAVDHFQFLQLSRFLTTISDFINQIDADRNFFSQQHSNGIIIPVVIMCLIDQVEVNFILARGSLISPYALHRGMTRSPSPVNQDINEDENKRNPLPEANLLPQAPSFNVRTEPSLETFPEFPHAVDNDLSGTMDETLSITTNTSDEECDQFVALDASEDDVFNDTEVIVVGEEVTETLFIQDNVKTVDLSHVDMSEEVNTVKASLTCVNAVVCTKDKRTNVTGYSLKLSLVEKLGETRGSIYTAVNDRQSHATAEKYDRPYSDAQVRFLLVFPENHEAPSIDISLHNLNLNLSDEVTSHLPPFFDDDRKLSIPVNLRVNIFDAELIVKDSKKKVPIKIKLKQCAIEQLDVDNDDDTR